MPVLPTYPGVYIEELSSGVRTITGVATSVTAFIGRAKKGPIDEPVTINSLADYERSFGGLWNLSTMSFAVKDFFLNGGSKAVIVRVAKGAIGSVVTLESTDPAPSNKLTLVASSVGSWGNDLTVLINHKNTTDNKSFNLTISLNSGASEVYYNVSTDPTNASFLPKVLNQKSQLAVVKQDTDNNYIIPANRPKETANPVKLTAGSDGNQISDDEIFKGANYQRDKKGLYALEKTDIFNILCIPPYCDDKGSPLTDKNAKPTDVSTTALANAEQYCKGRRAFLIVDPHSTWTNKKTALDSFSATSNAYPNLPSNYAALFFPRIIQPNSLMKNQPEEFVPCGAIAGVFARTDAQRGVWKSPAGLETSLSGISELSVSLTDMENGDFNQLGVNCIRSFPFHGPVVWGARTLEGADRMASEWKYIAVRRTALFLEESLYRGTQWVVFEPNDEPLWAQIRLNIGAFMHNLFRQGAFQGKTPKEAYLVKCDKETTTQTDINSGIVNILVGFAPLKPAEFVIIKIQQLAGQIEF